MITISDPEIRWRLSETFKRVQKLEGFGRARLKDMDNVLGHARLARIDARKECGKYLPKIMSVSYALLAALSEMALGMVIQENEPLPSDWISSSLPSHSNLILRANLIQLSNHGLSVLSLIERGFANSARSLIRTLIETSWVTVIFCGKRDKAQQYALGSDFDIAKEIWQRHFSPRSMMTALSDIEKRLGLATDITEYLHVHRQRSYQLHTQSAHNTCSVLGMLSFDSDLSEEGDDVSMYPALHGRVGLAAMSTLESTIDVLGYTVLMLFLLFRQMHNYKSTDHDNFWARSQAFAIGSLGLWFGARDFQPVGSMWADSLEEPVQK